MASSEAETLVGRPELWSTELEALGDEAEENGHGWWVAASEAVAGDEDSAEVQCDPYMVLVEENSGSEPEDAALSAALSSLVKENSGCAAQD